MPRSLTLTEACCLTLPNVRCRSIVKRAYACLRVHTTMHHLNVKSLVLVFGAVRTVFTALSSMIGCSLGFALAVVVRSEYSSV